MISMFFDFNKKTKVVQINGVIFFSWYWTYTVVKEQILLNNLVRVFHCGASDYLMSIYSQTLTIHSNDLKSMLLSFLIYLY